MKVFNTKMNSFVCLLLCGVAFAPSSLFAQAWEINPYAGYHWPGENKGVGSFQNAQVLGIRGGWYATKSFEVGANYNWTNHFQPDDENLTAKRAGSLGYPQGSVGANLFEAEFTYNFGRTAMFGSAVRPYLTGGFGGLKTNVKDPDTFVLNVNEFMTPLGPSSTANDVLESGDRFFTFSYGGGVKFHRVWGAMGFFGDFRGRTIPNFFGNATNWPEVSAGLTFSWGER
jgi:hypothetical protein